MLAHAHMHIGGIKVIIGELMVPTFYFTNEKKFWRELRCIMKSPSLGVVKKATAHHTELVDFFSRMANRATL